VASAWSSASGSVIRRCGRSSRAGNSPPIEHLHHFSADLVVPDLRAHGASTGHFDFDDAVEDVLGRRCSWAWRAYMTASARFSWLEMGAVTPPPVPDAARRRPAGVEMDAVLERTTYGAAPVLALGISDAEAAFSPGRPVWTGTWSACSSE
jgi:hypothetical protein